MRRSWCQSKHLWLPPSVDTSVYPFEVNCWSRSSLWSYSPIGWVNFKPKLQLAAKLFCMTMLIDYIDYWRLIEYIWLQHSYLQDLLLSITSKSKLSGWKERLIKWKEKHRSKLQKLGGQLKIDYIFDHSRTKGIIFPVNIFSRQTYK
jgi:hypothetical protein